MNRTFWTTVIVLVIACLAVILKQSARNRQLEWQLDSERQRIAQVNREIERFREGDGGPRDGTRQAIARTRAATTSEERVARTLSFLKRLIADTEEVQRSPTHFFKMLPDVLRIIQDLDLDEMLEVAELLEPEATTETQSVQSMAYMILLILAAEQDPHRVLELAGVQDNRELHRAALGALIRKDPEVALKHLGTMDISKREKEHFCRVLVMQAMKKNIESGLGIVRRLAAEGFSSDQAFNFLIGKDQTDEVIAALAKPENADMKRQLVDLLLVREMLDEGVPGARRRVEELEIQPQDLELFFTRNFDAKSEPEAMLDWMLEVQTPEGTMRSLPTAMARWAMADHAAAATWLQGLEPSSVRDIAIANYSRTIRDFHPESAVLWAHEIQEEGERQKAVGHAVNQWRQQDPEAAGAWLSENGYDSEIGRIDPLRPAPKPVEVPQGPKPVKSK